MKPAFYYMLLFLTLIQPSPAFSAGGEYQVKAAMLFNFTKFAEWPTGALGSDNRLFLCVAGKSGLVEAAQQLQGKQVKGRALAIRQVNRPDDSAGCQILFIPQSEKGRLSAYLQQAILSNILTVSDLDQFASAGGIIGLYEEDGKVRFEINPDAAQKGKIQISSQLLKLARIVR